MATYLQGVTDYIPQFQPFQPDLNLYANVLQTKQTQYDTAWNSLNKIYGQYFYADLTHSDNIKRKEEVIKNIDFNLKRVSGLDLSLSQNVTQAVQVFKPFYEDKFLMKDIAWTKNYNGQISRAEGFKNSDKAEQRARYWNTGVQALNYMRDEFKESSVQETLNLGSPEYVEYVNVQEKALKIAKDADLNIESVNFSPDGRWLIKKTNGDQLIEPLGKLFEAQLGNDPGIQAVYKTQAYVDRKDYAYSNAAQFNGDKNAAEMQYLEENFNILKEQNQRRYTALKEQSTVYSAQIADIKKQIANGTASPSARQSLRQYEEAKQINDKVLERSEEQNTILNGGESSTSSTSTGFENPYGDIKSLRWKVDNGRASMLMQKDLNEAAQVLAYRNAKVDMDANPYAVNEQQHAFRMQESAYRMNRMEQMTKLKIEADRKNTVDKARIEAGTHYYDEETNEVKPHESFAKTWLEQNDQGTSTDKMSSKEVSYMISNLETRSVGAPHMTNIVEQLKAIQRAKQITDSEIKSILGGRTIKQFEAGLKNNPDGFLRALGGSKLININKNFKNYLVNNPDLSVFETPEFQEYVKSNLKFDDYAGYIRADQKWRQESSYEVEKELYRQGFKYARFLYDDKGNIRSEKEFYKIVGKHVGSDLKRSGAATYIAGSPLTMGTTSQKIETADSYDKSVVDYDELKKAAWKTYAGGNIKTKSSLPGLEKFGVESAGSGKFTMGTTMSAVNPKGSTPSRAWFYETMGDLKNFDWGDPTKNVVSFGGTSATAVKGAMTMGRTRNDQGRAILNQLLMEMENNKTKMGNFRFGVSPIAMGNMKKAAIIIYPDMEWLKGQVYKEKDGKKDGPGTISSAEYNKIAKHGIAMIMDANKMNNSFYRNAYSSPLQSVVDYNKGYTYTDPLRSDWSFSITPNEGVGGGYYTTTKYTLYNPNTGREEKIIDSEPRPFPGESLEGIRDQVATEFFGKVLRQQNIENANRY